MRPFLELLPYRLERSFGWRGLRAARARRARRRSTSVAATAAPPGTLPRLFIDVAVISSQDAGTGIQRVVRALAVSLVHAACAVCEIRFVSARRKKQYFHIDWLQDEQASVPRMVPSEEEMRARPGDVFLGLDYSLDSVRRHRGQLAQFRRDGGKLWFLVHDLLPLNHPDWFSTNTAVRYSAWLGVLAGVADGFFCNSADTEAELMAALDRVHGVVEDYGTVVLPMGHAFPTPAVREPTMRPPRVEADPPFALMVGTLEPRKGHADVLAAFEELWKEGRPERLVLVGRRGWQVDDLCDALKAHPEYGARLLWFDDVDDPELSGLYTECVGVVVGSHREGFGLPVIEALGHGKPVLARDIAVFRVHDGKGVHFFPADAGVSQLAGSIRAWLDASHHGDIAVVRPEHNWRMAARIVLDTLQLNSGTREASASPATQKMQCSD